MKPDTLGQKNWLRKVGVPITLALSIAGCAENRVGSTRKTVGQEVKQLVDLSAAQANEAMTEVHETVIVSGVQQQMVRITNYEPMQSGKFVWFKLVLEPDDPGGQLSQADVDQSTQHFRTEYQADMGSTIISPNGRSATIMLAKALPRHEDRLAGAY